MNWLSYSVPLLEGAWITVQLTVYSTILGTATAFLFGIGKLSSNWFIKGVSLCFIEVFRGTRPCWSSCSGFILRCLCWGS